MVMMSMALMDLFGCDGDDYVHSLNVSIRAGISLYVTVFVPVSKYGPVYPCITVSIRISVTATVLSATVPVSVYAHMYPPRHTQHPYQSQ